MIFIDESGELGFKGGSSATFVMAATITDRPEEFRRLSLNYQPPSGRELKFKSSTNRVRREILNDVSVLGPEIRAIVVCKTNLPDDWKVKGEKLYIKTTSTLMDDIMKNTPGCVGVVFDHHTALHEDIGCKIAKDTAEKYGRNLISCEQNMSSKDDAALQTHDFVASAIGYKYNSGKARFFDQLGNPSVIHVKESDEISHMPMF